MTIYGCFIPVGQGWWQSRSLGRATQCTVVPFQAGSICTRVTRRGMCFKLLSANTGARSRK